MLGVTACGVRGECYSIGVNSRDVFLRSHRYSESKRVSSILTVNARGDRRSIGNVGVRNPRATPAFAFICVHTCCQLTARYGNQRPWVACITSPINASSPQMAEGRSHLHGATNRAYTRHQTSSCSQDQVRTWTPFIIGPAALG